VLAREQAARAEAQRAAAEAAEWRKRYEEAMQTASQLLYEHNALMPLASIVESSADAIFSQTLDGIILNWNTGAERLYGYAAAEIIGQPASLLAPPEQQEERARILERLRRGERVENYETVRRKKDGMRVEVSLTISPVKNAAGQIIGAAAIARDISAHKQAEEARLRLAAIVETTDDAIITKSLDGIITSWNAAAERIFGYRVEEMVGQSIRRLLPAERQDEEDMILARLRRGERVDHFETVRRTKDGRLLDISVTISPLQDARGTIIGASKIARDITARKRAEEAVRESQARYRRLFEAIDEGFCIIEKVDGAAGEPVEFRYVEANPAFAAQTGARDVVGKTIGQVFPSEPQEWRDTYDVVLRTGEPRRFEHTLVSQGRELDLYAFRVEDGTQRRVAVLFKDVTAYKRAEAARERLLANVQRSNDELQQFSYVVSHDLQEPLRTITSYVQLLARRADDKLEAEDQEFMGFVVEGAQRMQALIADLLAYTRVGGTARAFTTVDCEALLGRVLGDLRAAIKDSGAEVSHDPLPIVQGEAGQLGLVLQNLIGNALKFRGAAPPRIHVSARREGAQWVFAVRDNGIGLDPQHAERIFQIFQRLHARREYPGTGMGLAICKKIVERRGGRIWVESQHGQGATFFFTISEERGTLPLPRSTATSSAGPSPSA
jgi:PAS domain S-box-containing protein